MQLGRADNRRNNYLSFGLGQFFSMHSSSYRWVFSFVAYGASLLTPTYSKTFTFIPQISTRKFSLFPESGHAPDREWSSSFRIIFPHSCSVKDCECGGQKVIQSQSTILSPPTGLCEYEANACMHEEGDALLNWPRDGTCVMPLKRLMFSLRWYIVMIFTKFLEYWQ